MHRPILARSSARRSGDARAGLVWRYIGGLGFQRRCTLVGVMRMREFDEATIADAVLERVAKTPDLRARRVNQALVQAS